MLYHLLRCTTDVIVCGDCRKLGQTELDVGSYSSSATLGCALDVIVCADGWHNGQSGFDIDNLIFFGNHVQ